MIITSLEEKRDNEKKKHYITKLKGKLNLEKPVLFMTAEIGAKMNFLVPWPASSYRTLAWTHTHMMYTNSHLSGRSRPGPTPGIKVTGGIAKPNVTRKVPFYFRCLPQLEVIPFEMLPLEVHFNKLSNVLSRNIFWRIYICPRGVRYEVTNTLAGIAGHVIKSTFSRLTPQGAQRPVGWCSRKEQWAASWVASLGCGYITYPRGAFQRVDLLWSRIDNIYQHVFIFLWFYHTSVVQKNSSSIKLW